MPRTKTPILMAALAIVASAIGFGAAVAVTSGASSVTRPFLLLAEPGNADRGELNQGAVATARSYEYLPVLWLGEEYDGFRLTEAYERIFETPWNGEGTRARQFVLLYGDCQPDGDPDHSSCVKPVQIIVGGPGLVPHPDAVERRPGWSEIYGIEGTKALETDSGTVIWTVEGATVTVATDSASRDRAIGALRLANGARLAGAKTDARLGELGSLKLPTQFTD